MLELRRLEETKIRRISVKAIGKKCCRMRCIEWQESLVGLHSIENSRLSLRISGTEAPHTGGFDDHFEKGRYVCLCCGSELFK